MVYTMVHSQGGIYHFWSGIYHDATFQMLFSWELSESISNVSFHFPLYATFFIGFWHGLKWTLISESQIYHWQVNFLELGYPREIPEI